MQVYSAIKWCCRKKKQAHSRSGARIDAGKNMPHFYWAEAVNTVVYIMNRTPTAAVHDVTPEEKYTGNKNQIWHT